MINQELAELFGKMAKMLEFLGLPEDRFKIRAFQNASITLAESPEDLAKVAHEGRLRQLGGIGQGIAHKIEEYIQTGKVTEFEELLKAVPKGFFDMLEIPSLGPKKIRALYLSLGVTNRDELKIAIESGKVAELAGFGQKSAQKLLDGIQMDVQATGRRIIGTVYQLVSEIVARLQTCKGAIKVVPAGSFRRGEETVGDVDILATAKNPEILLESFVTMPIVQTILGRGSTKSSILTTDGLQVDLRVVNPDEFGSALQYFTGSKLHNVHLRTYAKNMGFKLSEYGFFKGDVRVASLTEEQCYNSLGMDYIPPELRTDSGEIEAALKHSLPKLIELGDIRGDLHAHSTWSDGENTIEEMALAAQKRGYEYLALTDHSPSLRIANGLTLDRLKAKKEEMKKLQEKFKITILFGTEVDILADGSIDYPDEILKEFDVVVASIHSRFNQDNTDRLLRAMENPFVHIIGHPSGRRIGRRKPYEVNYPTLFLHAVKTNTVLEINAQFERLDLQDMYMRMAKKEGVKFSLDTDSHNTQSLWLMELGIKWARRGWIEKDDVINTLPLARLRSALKKN